MRTANRLAVALVAALALGPAGCGSEKPAPEPGEPVQTTLVKRYVPEARPGGGFDLTVGPGEPHAVLDPLGAGGPSPADRFWSLAYWHVSTDQHIVDEECPARLAFFEVESFLGGAMADAFGLHEDLSPHLWNAAVLTANAVMRDYGRDFDLALSLGDSSDNGSRIEMEWFLQAADGPAPGFVRPDTGDLRIVGGRNLGERNLGSQEGFNPYTRPEFPNSNADFPAIGLRTPAGNPVPWFGVVGNHDTFNMGNFPVDDPDMPLNNFLFDGSDYVGGWSLFGYLRGLPTLLINTLEGGPVPPRGFYDQIGGPLVGGLISDPAILRVLLKYLSGGEEEIREEIDPDFDFSQVVPAALAATAAEFGVAVKEDPQRAFAGSRGLIELLRATGHGFDPPANECSQTLAGGPGPDSGYYSLDAFSAGGAALPIRLIVLNGNELSVFAQGGMSSAQFRWLKCELERARLDRVLVVLASHQQEYGFLVIGGENGLPLCLNPKACERTLEEFLLGYPNLVLHLVGHGHQNEIRPHFDPARPGRGYWEIQTASTSWWPQQTRVLELVIHENGVGEVWSTVLDHAQLSPDAAVNTLTGLARRLTLDDPHIARGQDGYPSGGGRPDDRNRVLRFLVPPEVLERVARLPAGSSITSRDAFPGGGIP